MMLKPLRCRKAMYSFSSNIQPQQSVQPNNEDYYRNLRIYKNYSKMNILNNLIVNKALSYDFIVNNAMLLYKTLHACLGKTLSNKIIEGTIGKVFTAGEDLVSLQKTMDEKGQGMSFILDYCSEALENLENPNQFYDENSQMFRNTILTCAKNSDQNNMIAIKISGLCSTEFLKTFSQSQLIVSEFLQQDTYGRGILLKIQMSGLTLTQEEQMSFLNDILDVPSDDIMITRTEWRYKVHACYLYDDFKNNNKVIRHFNQFSDQDYLQLKELKQRLDVFMEPATALKIGVAVDAEQSYLQPAIDNISEQMEMKHNSSYEIIVFNTIQNYLKNASKRIDYEISKAKRFSRPIALKMVRGAYMVEEELISKTNGTQYPICDSYEKTSLMYNNNVKKLLSFRQALHSQIIIASHNEDTIQQVKDYMQETNVPRNSREILFSQLYGLSDHLTYSIQEQGYQVSKYMPFGQTDIMIPYLIRRAQESRKMLSSNKLQSKLLVDELKRKFSLSKNL